MAAKIFKSIDEQIEILKSKGLRINDIDSAKNILLRENYFFLNGYRSPFLINGTKKFVDGSTFEELYSLFSFDRFFRNIIFKNILIVENNYKSILSYILSGKYGYKEKNYLDVNNFNKCKENIRQINDLIRKLKRQIRINGSQHQATSHYINNYGYVPLWVGVKVLSFGIVSEMFCVLKEDDRKAITNFYKITPEELEDYLSVLANYRNLCAHEDILYNHKTHRTIEDNKYHELLNIEKEEGEYIYGKNDLFSLIIILKRVLSKDDFKMMMNEIYYEIDWLTSKIKSISIDKILNKMGFPKNYREISYLE